MEYLDKDEWQRTTRLDYYLAQIALEAARGRMRNPDAVKIEHYLLKFAARGEKQKPVTQEQIDQRSKMSKSRWLAIAGVTKAGKARPPRGNRAPPTTKNTPPR